MINPATGKLKFILLSLILVISVFSLLSQDSNSRELLCLGNSPVFSPDGRFIAYKYKANIWVIDIETKEKHQVSNLKWDASPKWCPDGNRIMFLSYGDSSEYKNREFSVWISNIDGTSHRKIINAENWMYGTPLFSPTGDTLVWSDGGDLWTYDSIFGARRRLLDPNNKNTYYLRDWSHDGNSLLIEKSLGVSGIKRGRLKKFDFRSGIISNVGEIHIEGCSKFLKNDDGAYYLDQYSDKFYRRRDTSNREYDIFYISKVRFSDYTIEEKVIELRAETNSYIDHFDISNDHKFIVYVQPPWFGQATKIYIQRID